MSNTKKCRVNSRKKCEEAITNGEFDRACGMRIALKEKERYARNRANA